jgi:D-alanyl-lipoteichoic acid acyltransferase DltB (MBOAT superfamily)
MGTDFDAVSAACSAGQVPMNAVDLYAVSFWWFVGLAMLIMIPLAGAAARKWAFAGLNLAFLALHTRPGESRTLLGIIAAAVLAWLVLRGAGIRGRGGALFAWLGGSSVLALFLIHKLPRATVGRDLARLEVAMVGIGFSYVALRLVDVARAIRDGRHRPPDLPSTINYLLPFHMLAAGPIQAYDEFVAQPAVPPAPTAVRALEAIERVASGLFKKFVLANYLDRLLLTGFHARGPYFFLEMQLNFIWLYLDFSAYSDVAVGLGMFMGVATPENFRRPYLARNVTDFWERWHISLSQFIRRHLFFPVQLGLMRWTDGRSPLLTVSVALTVSFVCCGLWHGLTLPWLAWGLFQSAGLIVCNLYRVALTRRLGRKGVKAYLANRWIHLAAILLTFEFAAIAVAIATFPYQEISWWNPPSK